MRITSTVSVRCSFCNRSHQEVAAMVASATGVYICEFCIDLCKELIAADLDREPPPQRPPRQVNLNCSFCEKDLREVRKLIAGPRVYICNECTELSSNLVGSKPSGPGVAALSAVLEGDDSDDKGNGHS